MDFNNFILGLIPLLLKAKASLSPEGCEEGWFYFKDHCYNFIPGQVHFEAALEICSVVKKSTLLSLWKKDEYAFVTDNLKQIIGKEDSAWIGIISNQDKKAWRWADWSNLDIPNKDLPDPESNLCGTITTKGKIRFVDCDFTVPAFVCKKPLDMLYLPSRFNETESIVDLDQETIIFERQWPPVLDTVLLNKIWKSHLATIDVTHETDCAYRCYTVDDCRAFLLHCQASRKCKSYSCSLLSGIRRDEL